MNYILGIILFFLLWFYVQYEIGAMNPCSNFSNHPADCNSDRIE